jgi:hypothetical protein
MNTLIKAVAILVVTVASIGQLPKLISELRVAQAHLIEATKASKWGRAPLLPEPTSISNKVTGGHGRTR